MTDTDNDKALAAVGRAMVDEAKINAALNTIIKATATKELIKELQTITEIKLWEMHKNNP